MDRHVFLSVVLMAGAGGAEVPALRWDVASSNTFALTWGGRDVWRFHADPSEATKPYFDPVAVAGGPSLTWARPVDHRWHLGLWFSWKTINGTNYWEETEGRAQGQTAWDTPVSELRPDGSAVIRLNLTYTPAGLREVREIVISAPAADGAYTMDWSQRFTAGARVTLDRTPIPGETDGKPWGGYAGFSCRFAQAFSTVESFASTVGRVARDANGRLDVTGAAGAEQNGVIDGAAYGIAVLSWPGAPRAPGDWYLLENKDFTYLNAAFLLTGPYTLEKDATLELRYRVHVHPGRWNADALEKAAAAYAKPPIRVLLLTGANNHDWRATTPVIRELLRQSGRFTVIVNERPWEMKPADLDGVSLVLGNWNTWAKDEKSEWTSEMKAAFMKWVRAGGGLMVLHAGGSLFYDWDDFQTLTGGAWKLGTTFHPHIQPFALAIEDRAHPVTRNMINFETFDEPWQRIDNRNPARRVLVTGVVSRENKGSGEPEPFAFVTEVGQGRCFNLVLGHDVRALENPGCRALILRGAEWAATGDVR